jgi:hypothetical protein
VPNRLLHRLLFRCDRRMRPLRLTLVQLRVFLRGLLRRYSWLLVGRRTPYPSFSLPTSTDDCPSRTDSTRHLNGAVRPRFLMW